MVILAIETSCDETAIALLEARGGLSAPRFDVLGSTIASQIPAHRPFGGVVPNIAKREHLKNLPIVYRQVFNDQFSNSNFQINHKSQIQNKDILKKIDAICVTVGPGLEPALWTGIGFAKDLYKELKKENPKLKLIGTNHLEGHLYSFLLTQKTENNKTQIPISKLFPAIALIVSGGHTILLRVDSLVKWKKLGETKDDAVGESFDKVAKMLGLPYPGGPEIQKLAKKGGPHAIDFPRPMLHTKDYNFSYSGLKTSVLYYLRDHKKTRKADVAASFQEAALDVLVKKTARAVKEFDAKSILLSGGVAANEELRHKLSVISHKLGTRFLAPPMDFNTDNAVMIGVAGYMSILRKKNRRIVAQGNMEI